MTLSHMMVIWHALLPCLLLGGSPPQIRHSASVLLLSNTWEKKSIWCTLMTVQSKPQQLHNSSELYVIFFNLAPALLGIYYFFSSAMHLLVIHYSCFSPSLLAFFATFMLFLMLSSYFPWAFPFVFALLWCHFTGPAQVFAPGFLSVLEFVFCSTRMLFEITESGQVRISRSKWMKS